MPCQLASVYERSRLVVYSHLFTVIEDIFDFTPNTQGFGRIFDSLMPEVESCYGKVRWSATNFEKGVWQRLGRLQAGRELFKGSMMEMKAVNTVIMMASVVAHDNPLRSVKRLSTKMSSIRVFVTGKAFSAAVQLLTLPMVVMVLTFVLAARVFGRGFANRIVTSIDREEPAIHIIMKDLKEVHQVILRVLELDHHVEPNRAFEQNGMPGWLVQIEIGGHVFIRH